MPANAEVSIIPVMQGEEIKEVSESELPETLPILALRNAVLFPGAVFPITVGREKSIRLIRDAEEHSSFIGCVPQTDVNVEDPKEKDLYSYGTAAKIIKSLEMPDGTITVILQGIKRFSLDAVLDYEPFLIARIHYLDDYLAEQDSATIKAIADSLKENAIQIVGIPVWLPRSYLRHTKHQQFQIPRKLHCHNSRCG